MDNLMDGFDLAFEKLDPREKAILEKRYCLNGHDFKSRRKIGDAMGISGERVGQLERRAMRKIKRDVNRFKLRGGDR